jgi:hypothetical protein
MEAAPRLRPGGAQGPDVERDQTWPLCPADFICDAEHDHYTCPAGAKLTKIHRHAGVLVISAQKVTLSKSLIWADIFGAAEYKSLMSLTISFFCPAWIIAIGFRGGGHGTLGLSLSWL